MDFRLRVPNALLRVALDKAGAPGQLNRIIVKFLDDYANDRTPGQTLARQGGVARAEKLTPEMRSDIARKAGLAGGRGRPKTAPESSSD